MEDVSHETIEIAARTIADADALLITAGAGIGVDSGLPDFRGNEGFWRSYPPMKKLGVSFAEMANPMWFERDPALAWGFYGHRLNLYRRTEPHRGFAILRGWAEAKGRGHFVFTSNVDGQFRKAGFDPDREVECHGSIHHIQCTGRCSAEVRSADGITVAVDEATFRAEPPLPECRDCGALLRPNVLMFGDWTWNPSRTSEQQRRFDRWLGTIGRGSLAIVEVGAGSAVPTVRMTSEHIASRVGGFVVRINLREPQIRHGHLGIAGNALTTIEAIDAMMAGLG